MNNKPQLIIFSSGTKTDGGSGFENLVHYATHNDLGAEIVGVVSNHGDGGVARRAKKFGVPFHYFPGPFTAENYQNIVKMFGADYQALSGWLKQVFGLDPATTFNIHPGPLPKYGGRGMYGHHVHEKVFDDFKQGLVTKSAVSMHFVTENYDEGPLIFQHPVDIYENDTPDILGKRVNEAEHKFQPLVTKLVVTGKIRWDGVTRDSLVISESVYDHLKE